MVFWYIANLKLIIDSDGQFYFNTTMFSIYYCFSNLSVYLLRLPIFRFVRHLVIIIARSHIWLSLNVLLTAYILLPT